MRECLKAGCFGTNTSDHRERVVWPGCGSTVRLAALPPGSTVWLAALPPWDHLWTTYSPGQLWFPAAGLATGRCFGRVSGKCGLLRSIRTFQDPGWQNVGQTVLPHCRATGSLGEGHSGLRVGGNSAHPASTLHKNLRFHTGAACGAKPQPVGRNDHVRRTRTYVELDSDPGRAQCHAQPASL